MSSQSFYRKWRSQTFADVVGQGHVTRTLRNALQMGRIGHAYLFCGPRGVGKTSVARILAKGINCQRPRDGEPCNECSMCVAITEGRALDVIEVDAASNRRIEEMRDLRDKVKFSPSEGRYKVYILDEAHMLTNEASNALLKTLEEPPAHTVFVLVTTEAHKIAETIVSRCQRFNFRRILVKESVDQLGLVCAREGLSVEPEALTLVARAATGSLRDAEGLLDQLVAYCGREISLAQVQEILGLAGEAASVELAGHLFAGDLAHALEVISRVAEAGADLRRFADDFVGYLRSLLLVKSGADAVALPDAGAEAIAGLRQVAQRVALEDLVAFMRTFSETGGSRGAVSPQLALELASADAVLHLQGERQPAPHVERTSPLPRRELKPEPPRSEAPAARRLEPTAPPLAREQTAPPKPARQNIPEAGGPVLSGSGADSEVPVLAALPAAEAQDLGTLLEQLRRQWDTEVVDVLGAANKPLQALLRSCCPYEVRGGTIIVGCESVFHRDKVGDGQYRRSLEQRVAEVVGARVPLQFEVVPRQKRGQSPPPTSDPLVKEVLSWGGRIKAVVTDNKPSRESKSESSAERAGRQDDVSSSGGRDTGSGGEVSNES